MAASNIEKVLTLLKYSLSFLGLNFFKSFKSLNIFAKIYRIFCAFMIICCYDYEFVYLLWSQLFETDDLSFRFMILISVNNTVLATIRSILLLAKRKQFVELTEWMKSTNEAESNEVVIKCTKVTFDQLAKSLLRGWRISIAFVTFNSVTSAIGNYLSATSENSTANFLFPVDLPFISKDSKYYYSINYWQQNFCFSLMYAFIIFDFMIFYTITKHVLNELMIIIELSKKLGDYEEFLFQKERNKVSPGSRNAGRNKIHDVLNEILSDSDTAVHDRPTGYELLKLIHERHTKIMSIVQTASDFYLMNMLFWEFMIFITICYLYYLVFIFKGLYNMVVGGIVIIIQFYVISLIGANIMEKGQAIAIALYNSHWYYLGVRERKLMLNIFIAAQKPNTLSSGGFGNVSLSRFTSLLIFAYRACLLMSFLLEKSGQNG